MCAWSSCSSAPGWLFAEYHETPVELHPPPAIKAQPGSDSCKSRQLESSPTEDLSEKETKKRKKEQKDERKNKTSTLGKMCFMILQSENQVRDSKCFYYGHTLSYRVIGTLGKNVTIKNALVDI